MNWTDWIFDRNNSSVHLPTDLLALISRVEHNPGVDYVTAIRRVGEHFGGTPQQAVKDAIKDLKFKESNLAADWNAWIGLVDRTLPEPLRPLGVAMSELSKPLKIPLSRGAKGSFNVGELPFAWAVEAEASASAEAFKSDALDKAKLGIALGDGQVALRVSLQGSLSTSLEGTLAQTWGSVSASVKAETGAGIDLYAREAGSSVLLVGLLETLDTFPPPGDLKAALAVARGDRFAQLRLGLRGGLSAQGSVTVGLSVARTLGSLTPGGAPIGAKASVGAKLTAGAHIDGAYSVIVEPHLGGIRVRVEQSTKTGVDAALELGASIVVTGVKDAVDPLLEEFLPDERALLAKIAPVDKLSKIIETELGNLGWTTDPKLKELVRQVLDAGVSGQDAASKVAPWLVARIEEQLTAGLPWLTAKPVDVAASVSASILGVLRINDKAVANALAGALARAVESVQQKVIERFEDLAEELSKVADTELSIFLAPLARIGQNVGNLVAAAPANPSVLVEPLKAWLDAYAEFRKKIVDGVAKVAESKIGVKFAAKRAIERDNSTVFAVTILKSTNVATSLYQQLWRGRVTGLAELLEEGVAEGSLLEPEGVLTTIGSDKLTSEVSINFLGANFSSSTVQYGDVRVETDRVTGRIAVVTGTAKVEEKVINFWHEQFTNTMGVDVDLLRGIASNDADAPLLSAFSLRDQELRPEEVDEFIDSLSRFGLVRPEVKSGLYNQFAVNALAHTGFLRDVTLGVAFQLNNLEFRQVLATPRREVIETAFTTIFGFLNTRAAGTEELALCSTLLQRAEVLIPATTARATAEGIANFGPASGLLAFLAEARSGLPALPIAVTAGVRGPIQRAANWLAGCAKQAVGIANAFADLADAVRIAQSSESADAAEPAIRRLMASVASTRDLARSVFSTELILKKNEAPWVTIGFYATVGQLLKRHPPYGVVVTAIVPGPNGDTPFIIA